MGRRLLPLDSLRGLAAVAVLLHHARYAFRDNPGDWLLLPLFSGRSAVLLFFVLSGYVLSLPYWAGRASPYLPYVVRRVCRIYLPFLGAFALSAMGAWYFLGRTPLLSLWFQQTWHAPLTSRLVLDQLLLAPSPEINTAFWSLRYELQMSILMPLLYRVLRRWNAVWVTAAAAVLAYGHPARLDLLDWHHVLASLQAAVLFMMGATLARYQQPVKRFFARAGAWSWSLFVVSLVMYCLYTARLEARFPYITPLRMIGRHSALISGLGATGLIACVLHIKHLAKLLEQALPEYLGRISFSLYLLHGTVIFTVLSLFYGHVPISVLVAVILVASFMAAHVYCVTVEEPTIRFGRWLGRRLTPR